MAVYSMTGYASASLPCEPGPTEPPAQQPAARAAPRPAAAGEVMVEARSVNSRFLDLSFRIPDDHRALEPALRELVTAQLRRGKVEVRVHPPADAAGTVRPPTDEQLNELARVQAAIYNRLPDAAALTVHEALQLCRGSAAPARADATILEATRLCLGALREARAREGARLVDILLERVHGLRALAERAQPLVPEVVRRQQQRFLERWQQALQAAGAQADAATAQDRAYAEAAGYALRIDVAEELARLQAHLDEIERLLGAGGELGKRLDFLIQELHREANTLGSKSAALELTQISVEMKVLIEQMREQVQNVE